MKSTPLIASAVALGAVCLIGMLPARAAYIAIDDFSVPGQITTVAGDFEYGITVDGSSTTGIGNRVTVTAAASAGPVTFSGSWNDGGLSTSGSFAQVSADEELIYTVSEQFIITHLNGVIPVMDTITGEFCSAPTVCTIPANATITNVGEGPNNFNQAFLTANWQSNPVPEPASILLFGASLAGLNVIRRRRSA